MGAALNYPSGRARSWRTVLMARIKAPNADIDLAGLDLKNRAAPAGFPKGGGAYYARGARIAVLIADRITRDKGRRPTARRGSTRPKLVVEPSGQSSGQLASMWIHAVLPATPSSP